MESDKPRRGPTTADPIMLTLRWSIISAIVLVILVIVSIGGAWTRETYFVNEMQQSPGGLSGRVIPDVFSRLWGQVVECAHENSVAVIEDEKWDFELKDSPLPVGGFERVGYILHVEVPVRRKLVGIVPMWRTTIPIDWRFSATVQNAVPECSGSFRKGEVDVKQQSAPLLNPLLQQMLQPTP